MYVYATYKYCLSKYYLLNSITLGTKEAQKELHCLDYTDTFFVHFWDYVESEAELKGFCSGAKHISVLNAHLQTGLRV